MPYTTFVYKLSMSTNCNNLIHVPKRGGGREPPIIAPQVRISHLLQHVDTQQAKTGLNARLQCLDLLEARLAKLRRRCVLHVIFGIGIPAAEGLQYSMLTKIAYNKITTC